MTNIKRNPVGIALFIFFVGFLPIATFFFSKSGLDVHKNIKKEMRYHRDSIRINIDQLVSFDGDVMKNTDLLEKATIVCFWQEKEGFEETLANIRELQGNFKEEDQIKMRILVHTGNFSSDSSWAWKNYMNKWQIDTALCKFVKGGNLKQYQFDQQPKNSHVALLDGRVSRKDKTNDYLKGAILCDNYDLSKEEEKKKLLRNMVVVLPKRNRKRLEHKHEEKLF